MNKYIILSTFLLAVPSIAYGAFDRNLQYGTSGSDVIELQDILNDEKCLNYQSTGFFGLLTLNAVKCFQLKHGIPNTGYVGSMTRSALKEIVANATTQSNEQANQETGTSTPVLGSATSSPVKIVYVEQEPTQVITLQNNPMPVQVTVSQGKCVEATTKSYMCDNGSCKVVTSSYEPPKYVTEFAVTVTGEYKNGKVKVFDDFIENSDITYHSGESSWQHEKQINSTDQKFTIALPGTYPFKLELFSDSKEQNKVAQIDGEAKALDCVANVTKTPYLTKMYDFEDKLRQTQQDRLSVAKKLSNGSLSEDERTTLKDEMASYDRLLNRISEEKLLIKKEFGIK